jgi:UDP-glucose 4,6-dehydratase
MRLLVTGGCGFIGAGFCRRIIKNHPYLTLVNIDKLYSCSTSTPDLTTSYSNYIFVQGDIKNTELILKILEENNIDTVIHFAAQSHVDTSFTDAMLYTHDNVLGTHSMLEASRIYGKLKKFIHISTDEVYGENKDQVFTERSLLKPTNPYAASKASAEMFVHSYIHSFNIPAIVIRSNNVYGIGQYPEKVIPKFIFQLLDNKKLTIQGSGNQLRSFLHLEDAVDAFLCVLFQGQLGEIYNISSNDEISIRELAVVLIRALKPEQPIDDWITFIEDRHFNDKRYWIESEPLFKLGWRQNVKFSKGLSETIKWFSEVDRNTYWNNNSKKVLVWGSRGWIGEQFVPILINDGWKVIEAVSRADNREDVIREVEEVNPTHIVSLIGRTHGEGFSTIDYLEQPGKMRENLNDNLYAPIVLAGVAKSKGIHMLYMGTGCIFEYDDEHNTQLGFTEESNPNFFGSAYSTAKGFTDRIMTEEFGDTVLNVRIRMPISGEPGSRNFISKILSYKRICSIPNSMTVMEDILPRLAKCMEMKIRGPLNATNPGVIDHRTILNWYRDYQDPSHKWEEISNTELVSSCVKAGRSNNFLDTTRIESLFPDIPHILNSVFNIIRFKNFSTLN